MATPSVECPHCGYEIATYRETVEAVESGGRCLLCGGVLDMERLEDSLEDWGDNAVLEEGLEKAEAEVDVQEEDDLFEGVPDFGDDGEDEPVF